jgi:hypothetical protein
LKILAIDPGNIQSAFVVWEDGNFLESSEGNKGIIENDDFCIVLHNILDLCPINIVAIEFPQCYGMTVGKSIFDTCRWAGIFEYIAAQKGIHTARYGRPTIKGHIGGRTDAEIRSSLRIRHGEAKKGEKLEGVKKDIWAALALAVALDENPNLKKVE